jgi:hypothetical protein
LLLLILLLLLGRLLVLLLRGLLVLLLRLLVLLLLKLLRLLLVLLLGLLVLLLRRLLILLLGLLSGNCGGIKSRDSDRPESTSIGRRRLGLTDINSLVLHGFVFLVFVTSLSVIRDVDVYCNGFEFI